MCVYALKYIILLKNLGGQAEKKKEEATTIFSSNCSLQSNEDLHSHLYMKLFFTNFIHNSPKLETPPCPSACEWLN